MTAPPFPDKGLGPDEDMGGKAAVDLASVFPANVVEAIGFFGAAADIGGNALDEEVAFSSFFDAAVDDVVAKGLFGAVDDMGGKADEEGAEANGLFGANFDIGGNAEEDAGAVVFAVVKEKGFLGGAADIGGNAGEDTGAVVLSVVEANGLFGAAFDIGRKAALAEEVFFSFFKLKPAGAATVEDPTPNEKPPEAGVVDSSFFVGPAKLNPVPVDA